MNRLLDPAHRGAAESALAYAREVRAYHRRQTQRGSEQREQDLALALRGLKRAMRPLRSAIARFPHMDVTPRMETEFREILDLSAEMQAERRKLWKMQDRRAA